MALAPCRLASTAAATPAGPPPTTRTSVSATTGTSREGSRTLAGRSAGLILSSLSLAGCLVRLPADDELFENDDHPEEGEGHRRGDGHGRVEKWGVELRSGVDDEHPEAYVGS